MPIKCPVKRGNYRCSYPHCSQNTTPYTLTPKPTAPQNPKHPSATPQQPASIPISLPIPKATPVRDPVSQSVSHRATGTSDEPHPPETPRARPGCAARSTASCSNAAGSLAAAASSKGPRRLAGGGPAMAEPEIRAYTASRGAMGRGAKDPRGPPQPRRMLADARVDGHTTAGH